MPTIPAASPSRPSTRLTALAIPTTHNTVSTGIRSAERTTVVPANGNRKNSMLIPKRYRMVPARIWPDILAGGDISRRSSAIPTAKITDAPKTRPMGSDEPRNRVLRPGSCDATTMAASRPRNMAAPPTVAVGRSCTRRSSGTTMIENRTARRRTTKVQAQVAKAATRPTIT